MGLLDGARVARTVTCPPACGLEEGARVGLLEGAREGFLDGALEGRRVTLGLWSADSFGARCSCCG